MKYNLYYISSFVEKISERSSFSIAINQQFQETKNQSVIFLAVSFFILQIVKIQIKKIKKMSTEEKSCTTANRNPNNSMSAQAANLSAMSFRDDQVHDLMSSIQNKLSMLVCEDSLEEDFEVSKINSPKRQYLTATDEKRNNRAKITLQDLSTSNYRKHKNREEDDRQGQQLGESRVLHRINQMQAFYMQKIQQMSTKIASIEFDYEELMRKYTAISEENRQLKKSVQQAEYRDSRLIDKKVQEIKRELVRKFSDESQNHFEEHIKEMKELSEQLTNEKSKRRYLQNEVELLKSEKNNLEQFYRNLVHDHRNMIKLDLQRAKSAHKQPNHQNDLMLKNKSNKFSQHVDSSTRKKGKKKHKNSPETKRQGEMTKEEMIPFLAKGIQDLKDRLQMK